MGSVDLSGLSVSIAGTYNDDAGDDIWSVFIYIDETASHPQFDALSQIFSGQIGGNLGVTANFSTVLGIKRAEILLDRTKASKPSKSVTPRLRKWCGISNSMAEFLAVFRGTITRVRNPSRALQ